MPSSTLSDLWQQVTGTQPLPPTGVVLACAGLAGSAVLVRDVWRLARNVVTIAHEGGHALVAVLVGRRLDGIRLHSDTSGVTLSRGRSTGPGMVATGLAGYLAPSLVGLSFAALLAAGRITALLWVSIALLAGMLVSVRNAYGVAAILVTGLGVFAVSWFAAAGVQAVFAFFFTWFLLLAALRPVVELQRLRRRGYGRGSDADQLARVTGVPGLVWVLLFGLVSLAALALAGYWLVPLTDLPVPTSG
ncbi:MAG TPA: M50 family metallopeptidase [Mycobacteriales bacterium]|nr:M50 family metallopeptidase [Mycobacteriales bacterium]